MAKMSLHGFEPWTSGFLRVTLLKNLTPNDASSYKTSALDQAELQAHEPSTKARKKEPFENI